MSQEMTGLGEECGVGPVIGVDRAIEKFVTSLLARRLIRNIVDGADQVGADDRAFDRGRAELGVYAA